MGRRGMTPVVAMILVLLMTIATAGAAYAWFSGIMERQQQQVQRELNTEVSLKDVQCGTDRVTLAVYNAGLTSLGSGNFSVYVYSS